jgi:hypothetical protein
MQGEIIMAGIAQLAIYHLAARRRLAAVKRHRPPG